jgi:hypothetical protein
MPETRPSFTDVGICNQALSLLGENKIGALDPDDSEEAEFCVDFYETVVSTALTSWPWTFATKEATLDALTVCPFSEWQYGYNLPNDYLALQRTDLSVDDWAIFAQQIASNRSPLTIWYTYRALESTWMPLFVKGVVREMAGALAVAIQGASGEGAAHQQIAETLMAQARALDYQNNPAQRIHHDAGVSAARYGNSGRRRLGF